MFFERSIYYMPKQSQIDYWENEWGVRDIEKQVISGKKKAWWPILENILKNEIGDNDLIVEAGCGMGQFVYLMHKMGKQVIGVDVTEKAVSRTKKLYPELDLRVQDIRSLDMPDESVKLMLSLGVLEHFPEGMGEALMEAARVIEKGGALFLTIPYNNLYRKIREPWWRLKFSLSRNKAIQKLISIAEKEFYQYAYSENEVKKILFESGFKVEKVFLHHTHVAATKDFKDAWWFKLWNGKLFWKEVSHRKIRKWAEKREKKTPTFFAHIALYVARKS